MHILIVEVYELREECLVQSVDPSCTVKVLMDVICFICIKSVFVVLRLVVVAKRIPPFIKRLIKFFLIGVRRINENRIVASILKQEEAELGIALISVEVQIVSVTGRDNLIV